MSIGAGKGSTPRPVDPKKWSDGYDHAFKHKKKTVYCIGSRLRSLCNCKRQGRCETCDCFLNVKVQEKKDGKGR